MSKHVLAIRIGVWLLADALIILLNLPVHALIPHEGWSLVYSTLTGLLGALGALVVNIRLTKRLEISGNLASVLSTDQDTREQPMRSRPIQRPEGH